MLTSDFHYELPPDRIAQVPLPERGTSRLMVLDRGTRRISHGQFPDLPALLQPGDVLVFNNSRVIPARLRGVREETGGVVEALLIRETTPDTWWALVRPGKRLRPGARVRIHTPNGAPTSWTAEVLGNNAEGHAHLRFHGGPRLRDDLDRIGELPLPPYIHRPSGPQGEDLQAYQTVYARHAGSVAAPTAGLHYTTDLLERIRRRGIETAEVTLHVGLGTFAPVKTTQVDDHPMHEESFELGTEASRVLTRARAEGRRIIAAGTTSLRVLESVAIQHNGNLPACDGSTRLFARPPHHFQIAGALQTNFHLPESTLLMLVCAFADPGGHSGREWILNAYAEAIREGYRFFSYGDTMLIR